MFTNEQLKGFARWVLSVAGGLIAGWFAAKGWFTVDQVMSVFNSETAIGLLVTVFSLTWNMISKTKVGVVASAANVDGVQVVAPPAIANAIPSTDVKSTTEAKIVPK